MANVKREKKWTRWDQCDMYVHMILRTSFLDFLSGTPTHSEISSKRISVLLFVSAEKKKNALGRIMMRRCVVSICLPTSAIPKRQSWRKGKAKSSNVHCVRECRKTPPPPPKRACIRTYMRTPVITQKKKKGILINCTSSQSIASWYGTRAPAVTFVVRPKPYMGGKARLSCHRNESELSKHYRIRKNSRILLGYGTTFLLFLGKPDGTGNGRE